MAKLGDICIVQAGGTPSRSVAEYWQEGNIPWVKISDFNGKHLKSTEEYITSLGLEKSSAKLFEKGTILYTIFATLGEVSVLDIDAATNQAIAGLKLIDNNISLDYLYYFLVSKKEEVNRIGRGVAQNNINLGILKNFEIPLISTEEQKNIVVTLNKLNDCIELRKQQLSKLDELVKSRFIEMFGDVVDSPKYNGVPLGAICSTLSGGTPTTKVPEYYQGDIPWISTPYLGDNHINGKSAKAYITEKAIKNSATHLIPANTIMFGIRVGVGKSSIIDEPMCANQDIVALMGIDTSRYNLLFIKHVLDGFQCHFDSIKKGATILGITIEDLKKVIIPNVNMEVQEQFASFVEQTDKLKFKIKESLEKLETLKKSLMQKYFG